MKLEKERDHLKQMSSKELAEKVDFLKKELFKIRLNSMTTHVKDYSQFKKLRRGVARTLTYLKQKSSAETK